MIQLGGTAKDTAALAAKHLRKVSSEFFLCRMHMWPIQVDIIRHGWFQ